MLEMGYLSFPVLLVMIFLRAPIGLAMMLCGMGGPHMVLAKLKSETYSTVSGYSLTIFPMVLLTGQFATLSGMSSGLFHTPMMEGLPPEVAAEITANIPVPPRLGKPHEYAMLAEQIISNPFLNGNTIRLDGAVRLPPR